MTRDEGLRDALAQVREAADTQRLVVLTWQEAKALLAERDAAVAKVAAIEALCEGPTSDNHRPYAVDLGDDVVLAVGLDALRAALDTGAGGDGGGTR